MYRAMKQNHILLVQSLLLHELVKSVNFKFLPLLWSIFHNIYGTFLFTVLKSFGRWSSVLFLVFVAFLMIIFGSGQTFCLSWEKVMFVCAKNVLCEPALKCHHVNLYLLDRCLYFFLAGPSFNSLSVYFCQQCKTQLLTCGCATHFSLFYFC